MGLLKWDNAGVEPTEGKKVAGFQIGEKPPADYFNWLFNKIINVLNLSASKTGTETLENKTLEASIVNTPTIKNYNETVNILGSKTGSVVIDLELGNVVSMTVAGAINLSFANPPDTGYAGSVVLFVTNQGTNITFPSSVKWHLGIKPTFSTAGLDILVFTTIDGGITWHAQLSTKGSA